MKLIKLFFVSLIMIMPAVALSQSLDIRVKPAHEGYDLNTYPFGDTSMRALPNSLLIEDREILNPLAWSYPGQIDRVAAIVNQNEMNLSVYDPAGKQLMSRKLDFFDPSDQTLKLYPMGDGKVVIRDNVVNFTFLNAKGETIYTVSNSSQSREGELESRLASGENGRSVVLYNPVISYGNTTGSRAKIIFSEGEELQFFNRTDQEIKELNVSKNGSFITLLATDGKWHEVIVFDRFGSELYSYRTEDPLVGVNLSPKGEYITTYTSGRVQVFHTLSGEVAGSSSSRGSVLEAAYFPEEETIIILGGGISGLQLTDPTVTAVHLGKRQITRENIGESISAPDPGAIDISRDMNGRYLIRGLNKHLFVTTNF